MSMILNWLARIARCRPLADKRGSVNIIFGLSLIPMVGLVGLGVDYGVAEAVKSKLDNAADSAAVAAVATAKAYVAQNPSDANLTADAISAGMDRAGRAFVTNAGKLPFAVTPVSSGSNSGSACGSPAVTPGNLQIGLVRSGDGTTFTSCVAYATQTQNHFGTLFNSPTMTESGVANAKASIPLYLDFYLLVDVSGSMGLPANTSDQAAMLSAVSCQFACHFPGAGNSAGWNYAMLHGTVLRSGAVNTAVCGLLNLANQPLVSNQYRVGIYPFITQMATLAPISATITNVLTLAGCNLQLPLTFTNLLDTGTTQFPTSSIIPVAYQYLNLPQLDPSTGTGSGGTHFEGIFSAMQSAITNGAGFGSGAATNNSKPYVFLITDGMQNSQHYGVYQQGFCNGNFLTNCWNYPGNPSTYPYFGAANFDGSSPQAMDPSQCAALKSAGATISVLYIPYVTLTVGPQNQGETIASNNAIPNLPNALTTCAGTSVGGDGSTWMHTANSATDINTALQQMFQQAVQAAHLTK